MEGYTTHDVLADEVKSIFPIFAICFLIIEVVSLIVAAALYQTALLQYILFSLPNIAVLLMVVLCGFGLSALLVCRQNSAEHKRGVFQGEGFTLLPFLRKVYLLGLLFFSYPSLLGMSQFLITQCRHLNFLQIKCPGM